MSARVRELVRAAALLLPAGLMAFAVFIDFAKRW
jgi:hypothetical protein